MMTKLPIVAPAPPEQFGEIAKGISPGSVGRKAEGRVGFAAHEPTGLAMKRAEPIVPLKAAPVFRCGAARVLVNGHRSAPPACRSCGARRSRRASPESFRGGVSAWVG